MLARKRRVWLALGASTVASLVVARQVTSNEPEEQLYHGEPAPAPAPVWCTSTLRALPLRALSRAAGYVNSLTLPKALRKPVYTSYCTAFGCELEEVRDPLDSFRNLSEFYIRRLKPSARRVDLSSSLVSPCDGCVVALGTVMPLGEVEQIKGVRYPLRQLLGADDDDRMMKSAVSVRRRRRFAGDEERDVRSGVGAAAAPSAVSGGGGGGTMATRAADIGATMAAAPNTTIAPSSSPSATAAALDADYGIDKQLYYVVLHLSPGDYHRFHSPAEWHIATRRHIAGELLPVAPRVLRRVPGALSLNERVCMLGEWAHGFFGMVAVGSTHAGNIVIEFDPELHTNRAGDAAAAARKRERAFDAPVRLRRGQDMGAFRLGSCIVMVFEAHADAFQFAVRAGERVRVGQSLGVVG